MKFNRLVPVLLVFKIVVLQVCNSAFAHNEHSSDFDKLLKDKVANSSLETSIGLEVAAIIPSSGKSIVIQSLVESSEQVLYPTYLIDPIIKWSNDRKIFSTIISDELSGSRHLVAVDVHGSELYRTEIMDRSVDFGWKSSGNNQGLYLNSSANIVFKYPAEPSDVQRRDSRVKSDNNYIYDGRKDAITIIKNDIEIRKISGYLYDMFLSPSSNYLLYGSGGGFFVYDYSSDKSTLIEGGFEFSLSPDETKIAYIKTADDGHIITASDIYIYDVEKNTSRQLTNTPNILENVPAWVDGQTVRYSFFYDSSEVAELKVGAK